MTYTEQFNAAWFIKEAGKGDAILKLLSRGVGNKANPGAVIRTGLGGLKSNPLNKLEGLAAKAGPNMTTQGAHVAPTVANMENGVAKGFGDFFKKRLEVPVKNMQRSKQRGDLAKFLGKQENRQALGSGATPNMSNPLQKNILQGTPIKNPTATTGTQRSVAGNRGELSLPSTAQAQKLTGGISGDLGVGKIKAPPLGAPPKPPGPKQYSGVADPKLLAEQQRHKQYVDYLRSKNKNQMTRPGGEYTPAQKSYDRYAEQLKRDAKPKFNPPPKKKNTGGNQRGKQNQGGKQNQQRGKQNQQRGKQQPKQNTAQKAQQTAAQSADKAYRSTIPEMDPKKQIGFGQ